MLNKVVFLASHIIHSSNSVNIVLTLWGRQLLSSKSSLCFHLKTVLLDRLGYSHILATKFNVFMFIKQLQQFVKLLFNRKVSMIITPHIFSQIKRQSFSTNTTFSCQSSLKVSPETLKTIFMIAFFVAIFTFTIFYQAVYITFGCNTSIALPTIRIDYTASLYSTEIRGIRVLASISGTILAHTLPPLQSIPNTGTFKVPLPRLDSCFL